MQSELRNRFPKLKQPPRVVLFSGGTACRSINMALCGRQVALTRIVPAWDSGGSSKVIREKLDILSVGDIRQALMSMAHGEKRAGEVVKICNARLSDGLGMDEAIREFDFYADGRHPLLQRLEHGLRGTILNYLQTFRAQIDRDFDFRNGSVGNFILSGAYFAHNKDINTAIFVFRKLCGIEGNVWPVSIRSGIDLNAVLGDGRQVAGQHHITSLTEADAAAGIAELSLSLDNEEGGGIAANDAALEAMEQADAIVFGPGSFYTSILPHLLVPGLVQAMERNTAARRVLIGNILQCNETRSSDLERLLRVFRKTWQENGGDPQHALTDVIANRELFPFKKTVGAFAYLENGALEDYCRRQGIGCVIGEFEDAWSRGKHDGEAVADVVMQMCPPR